MEWEGLEGGTELRLSQLPQVGGAESNTHSGFAEQWDSDRTVFLVHGWKGVQGSWGSQQ